jgi:hypothetical protein
MIKEPATKPAKKLRNISKVGKKKKFKDQAGFEPMTTGTPTPALVRSATQLAAAKHRFLPNL